MKKFAQIVGLISILSVLNACEESPPPTDNSPETANADLEIPPGSTPSPDLPYALRAADNSWPGGEAPAQLAEDWLAANYYLVLDGSGSMARHECTDGQGDKMTVAKQAIAAFIEQIPPQAHVALFVFDAHGVSERVGFEQPDRAALHTAIAAIEADGYTPLLTSVRHGYDALRAQAAKQLGYGEYHLVVITDGLASPGEDPTPIVTQLLHESPVVLHTIGFCIDDQHPLNQAGRSYYTSANNPDELRRGLQAILAEAPDFTPGTF